MAKGRPRKPTAAHILDGTHRSDRHGEQADQWQPDGAPKMPAWLNNDAQTLWQELSPRLVESNVATCVDAAELAALCDWWARYREAARVADGIKDKQSTKFYRLSILASMAWKNFATAGAKFGLNPSDRARLKIDNGQRVEDELLSFTRDREQRGKQQ